MMNLQELLDELDIFRKLTGVRLQDLYNLMLRRGWTLGSRQMMRLMHGVIHLYHPRQVALLENYWRQHRSDLVVSLIPNFNRPLYQSLKNVWPGVPLVTILTDLADFPPHFWIERNQPQFFICGTDRAYRQALAMGHPPDRVFRTSGMILSPKFYASPEINRNHELKQLGLEIDTPTILLMFGGEGSSRILEIVKALDASDLKIQVIAVAGKNAKLETKLRGMSTRMPLRVEGFTRDIPRLMRLSSVFIGKPGPGSISEAVAMGLPVIIEKSIWTLPQERYNAEWVEETGVGRSIGSYKKNVVAAVRDLLNPTRRKEILNCLAAQRNRAVFEIPEILDTILNRT